MDHIVIGILWFLDPPESHLWDFLMESRWRNILYIYTIHINSTISCPFTVGIVQLWKLWNFIIYWTPTTAHASSIFIAVTNERTNERKNERKYMLSGFIIIANYISQLQRLFYNSIPIVNVKNKPNDVYLRFCLFVVLFYKLENSKQMSAENKWLFEFLILPRIQMIGDEENKTHKCCISWIDGETKKRNKKLSPQTWRICHLFEATRDNYAIHILYKNKNMNWRVVWCI